MDDSETPVGKKPFSEDEIQAEVDAINGLIKAFETKYGNVAYLFQWDDDGILSVNAGADFDYVEPSTK